MTPLGDNDSNKPRPRKIVTYPISGDDDGGALYVFGDPASSRIAIMSAGFPDDQTIFCPLAARLAKETGTLVGVTCLPGFDDRDDKPWTARKKDGYTWDEIASAFREAARALRSESAPEDKAELVGIFHDWAVVPGMMWCNRAIADGSENAPEKIVLLDVCMDLHDEMEMEDPPAKLKPSAREEFIGLFYRSCFAWNFLAQRYLGSAAAYVVAYAGIALMRLFRLSPTLPIDAPTPVNLKPSPLHFYRCYPYYQMFKSFLTGGMKDFKDATLPKDLNKTPVLYLYGPEKRIQFVQDYSVLTVLERERRGGDGKSNAVAVEGAGHWLYCQKFDYCFSQIKNFIV